MTTEQEIVLLIKGAISELPPEDQEAVNELAEFIRTNCKNAGEIVGGFALALVGAEAQLERSK